MKANFSKGWEKLRASYWFVPTLMSLMAFALSFLTIGLDRHFGPDWLDQFGWLEPSQPSGARELLSTVAGSMITVAGVTFSITITSVSLASQQFGPRLLSNFMRDRGNQIVLGTFVATFLYCILVLRTIHDGDEVVFVPQISVLVAVFLTLANLGVLIYFIHHVAESLQASTIISTVCRQIHRAIENMFPAQDEAPLRHPLPLTHEIPEQFDEEAQELCAREGGYIQTIWSKGLVKLATSHDVIIKIRRRQGEFVMAGDPLAMVWPADRLDDGLEKRVLKCFALHWQRTPAQDILFLVNELVEMSARALSTGVNDPFTVISCLDCLSSVFTDMVEREWPPLGRFDSENRLRVITHRISFEDFAETAFGQLRPYVSRDRNATLHMLNVLGQITLRTSDIDQQNTLARQAELLLAASHDALPLDVSRREVLEAYGRLGMAQDRKDR